MFINKSLIVVSAIFVSLSLPSVAMAQFKWKDPNGRWVYSDQPPPSNAVAASPFSGDALPKTPVAKAAVAAQNAKDDKELASKRSELDKQAALKLKQEKQDIEQKNQAICDKNKANLASIQSGVRVKTTEANGEFRVLNDADRQAQAAIIQKDIISNCKS